MIVFFQGLAYNAKKNLLYVADTENHALRYVTMSSNASRNLKLLVRHLILEFH